MLTSVTLSKTLKLNTVHPNIVMPSGLAGNHLRIEATDASDNPLDLFVYQTEILDLYAETSSNPTVVSALFQGVASPNDLEELPVGVPDEDDGVEVFMLSYVDVYTRSTDEAEFIWEEIQADVRGLVRHFQLLTDPPSALVQFESVTIE